MAGGVEQEGWSFDTCPVADGGEGTASVLVNAHGGTFVSSTAHDPLGRPRSAEYALLADGKTAVIDCASASGLPLTSESERDASRASSRGTGELIAAAINSGASKVIVGAGGIASTDGGAGAIAAINEAGGVRDARLMVLCDVAVPWEQAAPVFAPQKGAGRQEVVALSRRMTDQAEQLPRDPRGIALTGAAGGLAGGLWAAFGAELRPGAAYVLESLGFERRLGQASIVLVGEGRLDDQSFMGKIIGQIVDIGKRLEKPVYAIAGALPPESALQGRGLAGVAEGSTLADIRQAASRLTERAGPQSA